MSTTMITETVNELIEKKALIMKEYPIIIDNNETVTYCDLWCMINKVSNSLLDSSIREGDRVLLIGYNSAKWICFFCNNEYKCYSYSSKCRKWN